MNRDTRTIGSPSGATIPSWAITPLTLGVLGIAGYLLVHAVLAFLDVDAKSDGCMRIQLLLIWIGPPYASIVLIWAFVAARRERRWSNAVPAVVVTVLMLFVWFSLLSAHSHAKHEIEVIQAMAHQHKAQ